MVHLVGTKSSPSCTVQIIKARVLGRRRFAYVWVYEFNAQQNEVAWRMASSDCLHYRQYDTQLVAAAGPEELVVEAGVPAAVSIYSYWYVRAS